MWLSEIYLKKKKDFGDLVYGTGSHNKLAHLEHRSESMKLPSRHHSNNKYDTKRSEPTKHAKRASKALEEDYQAVAFVRSMSIKPGHTQRGHTQRGNTQRKSEKSDVIEPLITNSFKLIVFVSLCVFFF